MSKKVEPTSAMDEMTRKTEILNKVSPTMCLAKWVQSTTTLYNGMTHSCHHPIPHKIKVEDIINNPQGLHNTPTKIKAREDMLNGIQTSECDYCWKIENMKKGHLSDRSYKSASNWAWPALNRVLESGNGANINPTYLEIAFENICNFRCAYCSPEVSSRWMDEVKTHGGIQLTEGKIHDLDYIKKSPSMPIAPKDYNPYIEAFWKWWPDLYTTLDTFRITGGEPLLSDNTWKILEYVKQNPRPDFTIAINTNMGVPRKMIERLTQYAIDIAPHIKQFQIFTSAESTKEQCEYIRHGMVWNDFTSNIEYFLDNAPHNVICAFMVTANILSAPSLIRFLQYILDLRNKYNKSNRYNRVPIMINYLRYPPHMIMTNIPDDLKKRYTEEWNAFAKLHDSETSDISFFNKEEIDQIKRLADFMNSIKQKDIQMSDFYRFFTEYDRRRKEDFNATFPDLIPFMQRCKEISSTYDK